MLVCGITIGPFVRFYCQKFEWIRENVCCASSTAKNNHRRIFVESYAGMQKFLKKWLRLVELGFYMMDGVIVGDYFSGVIIGWDGLERLFITQKQMRENHRW
jgi:hypothetical protein